MTLMAIGIDFRSTVAVATGIVDGPFSRRLPAACAGVSPLACPELPLEVWRRAEHAVVVRVAARASQGKNGPTVKRMGGREEEHIERSISSLSADQSTRDCRMARRRIC
jgi:hypothetical protein